MTDWQPFGLDLDPGIVAALRTGLDDVESMLATSVGGEFPFLTEVARDEIQRLQQRNALRAAKGAWKDEDHPELKDGAAAWVSQMRAESETRFQEIEQQRNRS